MNSVCNSKCIIPQKKEQISLSLRGDSISVAQTYIFIEINCVNKRVALNTLYLLLVYIEWEMEKNFIISSEFLFKRNLQSSWRGIHVQENEEPEKEKRAEFDV